MEKKEEEKEGEKVEKEEKLELGRVRVHSLINCQFCGCFTIRFRLFCFTEKLLKLIEEVIVDADTHMVKDQRKFPVCVLYKYTLGRKGRIG